MFVSKIMYFKKFLYLGYVLYQLQLAFFLRFYLFIHVSLRHRDREREAETQAEGEAGSMWEPHVGLDPGSPGSGPGPMAGAKPLSHPGIPVILFLT